MANPTLNDAAFEKVTHRDPGQVGWGAPQGPQTQAGGYPPNYPPPAAPDEVSPWRPGPIAGGDTMTVNGAITATGVLLVLLVGAAALGWNAVEIPAVGQVQLPGWIFLAWIGSLVLGIGTAFKPDFARVTGPLYAIVTGAWVGALSALYNAEYDGIVFQAVAGTVGVLAMMLFLYATRIVKVTDKLRMGVIMATGAIMLVYLFNIVLSLFGVDMPFIHDAGPVGILISLVIVGVAAMNLLLDFDFVERAVAAGAPKKVEWYAAFGLMVTLVWLYLEILRLLSKLNRS
jgi:uncharacterized YccA/Bax inhibitor family protein